MPFKLQKNQNKFERKLENEKSYVNIKNEVSCVGETIEYTSWFDLCSDEKKRIQYINRGMTYAELFLRIVNKRENINDYVESDFLLKKVKKTKKNLSLLIIGKLIK